MDDSVSRVTVQLRNVVGGPSPLIDYFLDMSL